MSWKVLQNPYTHLNSKGWNRITILRGQLYVKNVGQGQGSRDGVFLLVLLELLKRFPERVPDVDFVLYTEDRARLSKAKHLSHERDEDSATSAQRQKSWRGKSRARAGSASGRAALPFALGFARHDDFLDVAVPDPSFFGWPEMGINPHWQLTGSPVANLPWSQRLDKVHWRGGMRRSGKLREALVACAAKASARKHASAKRPPPLGRAVEGGSTRNSSETHSRSGTAASSTPGQWMDVLPRTSSNWEHPLAMGQYKLALFIQGEGYTSSKQRTLASGSCPVFAELTGHDTYFGRWLKEGTHYRRVRVGNGLPATPPSSEKSAAHSPPCSAAVSGGNACASCSDLENIARWAFLRPGRERTHVGDRGGGGGDGGGGGCARTSGVPVGLNNGSRGDTGCLGAGGSSRRNDGEAGALDEEVRSCARAASEFSTALFSRGMLLEYLLTVLQEVSTKQGGALGARLASAWPEGSSLWAGYDYEAVLREVHGSGGKGETRANGLSAVEPVTEGNVLAVLEKACGHLDSKGDCSEAVSLVKWWLGLGPEEYTNRAEPPCRTDLCSRCCNKGEKRH